MEWDRKESEEEGDREERSDNIRTRKCEEKGNVRSKRGENIGGLMRGVSKGRMWTWGSMGARKGENEQ